ncbi:ribosome biogenesis protein ytm1 [Spiromyces aspiralis]|uniref:Ribosome biogenesis protein ytm1 n=1 Tax=Spiromyces aspiralis TaxID=68401 RepID=A0ACC1HGG9_9FUNG|nr:ribosome biogenesis protein ytm1 [Spiromyces aspiralis]
MCFAFAQHADVIIVPRAPVVDECSYCHDVLDVQTFIAEPLDQIAVIADGVELLQSDPRLSDDPSAKRRLTVLESSVGMLKALAKAHNNLKEIDDYISKGDIVVASNLAAETQYLLDTIDVGDMDHEQADLVRRLQAENTKITSVVVYTIDHAFDQIYAFSSIGDLHELRSFTGDYYESAITISQLYYALSSLGLAHSRIKKLAHAIADRFMAPFALDPSTPVKELRSAFARTLSIGAVAAKSQDTSALPAEKLKTILSFIRKCVFHGVDFEDEQQPVYAFFGSVLWDRIWPILERQYFEALIPSDEEKLEDYHSQIFPLIDLEEYMVEVGLLHASQTKAKQIAKHTYRMYFKKRRTDLLVMAKELFTSEATNVVAVGHDDVGEFGSLDLETDAGKKHSEGKKLTKGGAVHGSGVEDWFPRCKISIQAQTLVELCHQTLAQIEADNPQVAAIHYQTARDILNLYRCVVPSYSEAEIAASPARTMVLFNDCMYVAHHLATMAQDAQTKWPELLRRVGSFADLIQQFRNLGRRHYEVHMNRAALDISSRLAGAEGTDGSAALLLLPGEPASQEHSRFRAAVFYLTSISKTSVNYLPHELHLKSLGLLADVVLENAIAHIKAQPAFDADTSRQLQQMVKPIYEIQPLFSRKFVPEPTGRNRAAQAPIEQYSKRWQEFEGWMQILTLDTSELALLRKRGELLLKDQSLVAAALAKRDYKQPAAFNKFQ